MNDLQYTRQDGQWFVVAYNMKFPVEWGADQMEIAYQMGRQDEKNASTLSP